MIARLTTAKQRCAKCGGTYDRDIAFRKNPGGRQARVPTAFRVICIGCEQTERDKHKSVDAFIAKARGTIDDRVPVLRRRGLHPPQVFLGNLAQEGRVVRVVHFSTVRFCTTMTALPEQRSSAATMPAPRHVATRVRPRPLTAAAHADQAPIVREAGQPQPAQAQPHRVVRNTRGIDRAQLRLAAHQHRTAA
jgi:hypothetical protein